VGANPLEPVLQDLRFAARSLSKTPTFTLVAVLSLALGIGATTTVFSVVDSLLLRPLPVNRPERLVTLEQLFTDGVRQFNLSHSDAQRFGELTSSGVWSALAATSWADAYDAGDAAPGDWRRTETLRVSLVTGEYFTLLGLRPRTGRPLVRDDDRESAPRAAVIADRYWSRRFGRSTDALGREIQLNGTRFVVVGVAPEGFHGDWVGWPTDVWVPATSAAAIFPAAEGDIHTRLQYKVLARLADGVSLTQARTSAEALYREMQRNPPARSGISRDARLELVPAGRGYSPQRASLSQSLTILASTVALALLVICGNVANLLLVRTAARERELAVRISLGATRGRLVRQLMTENLLLTGAGAAAGFLLAAWGTDILAGLVRSAPVSTIADGVPALELAVALDGRAIAFTLCVALASGLLFGLIPALRGSNVLLIPALQRRHAGALRLSRRTRPRTFLLVGQIAASTILLIGTGLFIRSVSALRSEDLGFDRDRLLLVWALPGPTGRRGSELEALWQSVEERLRAVPGVESAAVSVEGLLGASPAGGPLVAVAGSDAPAIRVQKTMTVAPGFFSTVGQALLDGRDFTREDREDAPPVAIVSESFARRAFGSTHVAGRRIRIGGAAEPAQIAGVVADAKHAGPRTAAGTMLYYPPGQNLRRLARSMCVVIRSAVAPVSLAATIRRELRVVDPALPVLRIDTIEEQLSAVLYQERLITSLAAFFAGLAMLLTALGLYAVLAFATDQRRREIGIRLALGASPSSVMRAVVRDGTMLVLAGLAIGIPAGVATLRLVSSRLFGVGVADPLTIVSVAAVLITIAELGVLAPARRAASVDPALALRAD
jgi:predicted permease